MALPHGALVLVADGRKMLFLRNQGDEKQIDLRTEAHDERSDTQDRNLRTDAPGTSFQSFSPKRSSYEETDFHQLEEDRWATRAAEEINRRALRNDFDALTIVAPPKALAVIRKELHKEAERRVIATLNKAMTDRPIPEIEAMLIGEGAPPA
jgi:protein required for attachment to host cells